MPFDINANLLALTSKGNITFVRLFDLNTLESNESKLPEGLFIFLQIVLIASAPWKISSSLSSIAPLSRSYPFSKRDLIRVIFLN